MPELAINGGTPVRSTDYPAWPVVDDEVVAAVTDVVRSGEWGGFPEPGVNGGAFEEAFAAYQGAAHGVLMMNGTVTMEVACKALDIGWGDEVIVPALTFAATAYAPMAAGAIPVFVDVTPETWTIDPDARRSRDHRARTRDHAGAPGPSDGGHGSDHGDRRHARAGGHRGLRARTGPAMARPGRGVHRRLRLLQPPVVEDPHVGRRRDAPHERRHSRPRAHSIIDCGRAKDPEEKAFTFGANYRLWDLTPRSSSSRCAVPRAAGAARRRGKAFEAMAPFPGVRVMPHDERVTRWSFYNYLIAIDPEVFGGGTNGVVAAAMEAEGIPAEVQYPSMNRYELFQPSLSRLPVASSTPTGLILSGCRSRWPRRPASASRSTSWRTSSGMANVASGMRSTRSRRSNDMPGNCRADDVGARIRRRRTAGR